MEAQRNMHMVRNGIYGSKPDIFYLKNFQVDLPRNVTMCAISCNAVHNN